MLSRLIHRLSSDRLLTEFLLAVLLLRALVPAGFMPGTGSGMLLTMTMCGSGNPAAVTVRLPQDPAPGPSAPRTSHADGYCAYAASSVAAPPPVVGLASLLLPRATESDSAPVPTAVLAAVYRAQSPRAPPSIPT
jgi:hypothetical protein